MFVSHADRLWTCPDGHLLAVYYSGMLVVLSLHIVTTAVEIALSTRGSITHEAPRRHMAALLYGRLALVGGEVVWTALGTYWAFCERTSACERHVLVAVKVAVIVGWLILVALVVGLVVVFDPLGGSALSSSDDDLSSAAARLWKIRLLFPNTGLAPSPASGVDLQHYDKLFWKTTMLFFKIRLNIFCSNYLQ